MAASAFTNLEGVYTFLNNTDALNEGQLTEINNYLKMHQISENGELLSVEIIRINEIQKKFLNLLTESSNKELEKVIKNIETIKTSQLEKFQSFIDSACLLLG